MQKIKTGGLQYRLAQAKKCKTLFKKYLKQKRLGLWLKWESACLVKYKALSSNPSTAK
jgi:hypothetical protein